MGTAQERAIIEKMETSQEQQIPDYLCGESQWETAANTQLYNAASDGDLQQLRDALEQGANTNYWSKDDEMLGTLHAAARNSDSALCAEELVKRGARVSAALISNRNEPIHEAANAGAKEVCRVLIDASNGKAAESENAFGNTALHAATRSGSADVVQLLLDKGADCNKANHRGSTALHVACFLASNENNSSTIDDADDTTVDPFLKIAAILICHDELEIDIKDVNGYTPAHIAAQRGCNDMVKLLIDSGVSLTAKTGIDAKGRGARTPAGMAKFGRNADTLKVIEDAMANDGDVVTNTMASKLLQ